MIREGVPGILLMGRRPARGRRSGSAEIFPAYHRAGRKRLHHPIVGDLDLSFEALELPAAPVKEKH